MSKSFFSIFDTGMRILPFRPLELPYFKLLVTSRTNDRKMNDVAQLGNTTLNVTSSTVSGASSSFEWQDTHQPLRFASLSLLSANLPGLGPRTPEARKSSPWYSRRESTLVAALVLAATTLLVNFISLLVFRIQYPHSTIHRGDCQKVSDVTSVLHGLINLLSTILLGASNKCMQILAAPTRKETDKAHSGSIWLDIGVPSIRNVRHIAKTRVAVWFLLGLSSVPLHLL